MKYFVVENNNFPECVSCIHPFIETSMFEGDALHFSDPEKAEEIRRQVQENTGNRWSVYEVTESRKEVRPTNDIGLTGIHKGYLALKSQDEVWNKSVYDFLHKVLDNRDEKRISYPVNKDGHRFQLDKDVMANLVVEVYVDDENDIIVDTEYGDTRYVTMYEHDDLSIDELYFLCECLEHYLNED